MGKFIIVVLLAAGALTGGYYLFLADGGEGTEESGSHGDGGILPDEGNGDEPADPQRLDPELVELLERTDAAWQELADAGENPVIHERTVELARAYSRVLRGTYNKPACAELQQRLVARLTPVGDHLFLRPTHYHEEPTGLIRYHEIEPGQLFPAIGKIYGVSEEHINIMRGKAPDNDRYGAGERVKVVDTKNNGGFFLHVDKSDFFLDLYVGGVFCKRFPIGHGKPGFETPSGETIIESRLISPAWTNPEDHKVYHKGDPGYIIGDYWLGLRDYGGRSGLAFHGYTGQGEAVGGRLSAGCIRLRNEDAALLYNVLVPAAVYESGFKSRAPMRVEIVD